MGERGHQYVSTSQQGGVFIRMTGKLESMQGTSLSGHHRTLNMEGYYLF
jgi:hypothetical protein